MADYQAASECFLINRLSCHLCEVKSFVPNSHRIYEQNLSSLLLAYSHTTRNNILPGLLLYRYNFESTIPFLEYTIFACCYTGTISRVPSLLPSHPIFTVARGTSRTISCYTLSKQCLSWHMVARSTENESKRYICRRYFLLVGCAAYVDISLSCTHKENCTSVLTLVQIVNTT
jgi:hypothetical protein